MVRPGKTERILQQRNKYIAMEAQLNLDKHLIVGPFNFAIPKEYDDQPNRVPDDVWIDLSSSAEARNISVTDLNDVEPLTAASSR